MTGGQAPSAWCFAGAPGSGKSTLGRAVARLVGATVLDLDTATNPLIAQIAWLTGAGDDMDHESLRGAVREARYRCLIDLAAENLGIGRSVVLIAPFTSEATNPEAWRSLRSRLAPSATQLVWVSVPAEVALARRRQRGFVRDLAMSQQSLTWGTRGSPVVDHLLADGAAPTSAEAARVASALGWPGL